jgi:hypothetical protein
MHVDLKEVEFFAASFNRLENGLEMVFTVKISSFTATADIYRISGVSWVDIKITFDKINK